MKLLLQRENCGKDYTRGRLFINGIFECYTLEDTDRKMEDGGEKVYGGTCIPRGTYSIDVTLSNRFKRRLPILKNVPGFEGIRIHPGNTAADTEGCILVGVKDDSREDKVLMSRVTFDGLFGRIEKALLRSEKITIEIV
jgi:hypothetical protein